MKKIALATAFLFASSMFVLAQSTSTPSSTDQQQPSATSPSQSSPASTMPSASQSDQSQSGAMGSQSGNAEKAEKIEGCLSQGANGYTLASASGTTYNLTGDTSKLASHVGEQVEVKGSPSSSSSAASSATSPSSATSDQSASSASA